MLQPKRLQGLGFACRVFSFFFLMYRYAMNRTRKASGAQRTIELQPTCRLLFVCVCIYVSIYVCMYAYICRRTRCVCIHAFFQWKAAKLNCVISVAKTVSRAGPSTFGGPYFDPRDVFTEKRRGAKNNSHPPPPLPL